MCLGIPGKIIHIEPSDGILTTAIVDIGGIQKKIVLSLTPEATIHDYVLVHAGFAIALINSVEAEKLLNWITDDQ